MIKGEVLGAFRDEWEIRKIIDDRPDAPITVQAITSWKAIFSEFTQNSEKEGSNRRFG